MSIQWFPGHMNAARKKAAESMEKTDMVIEVLDARMPQASANPMIEQLRLFRKRPSMKNLNKSDLDDPAATKECNAFYNLQKDGFALACSCLLAADVAKIPGLCVKFAPHRGSLL